MDIASVIGFIGAYALMYYAIIVGGGNMKQFYDLPSIVVVFGGAVAAALMSFPLKDVFGSFKVSLKFFLNKQDNLPNVIKQLVELAEIARRDGLLALEGKLAEVNHKFIKLGMQMAVDGSPPEVIEDVLRTEVDSMSTRHGQGKAVMDCIGKYGPAFGMIGTLLGLVMMLSNMSDPSSIGKGMAVALLTTLYGAVLSNAGAGPMADKLNYYNKQEILSREIIIRGVLAIQSGENPRVIQQKLLAFVPPKKRPKEEAA